MSAFHSTKTSGVSYKTTQSGAKTFYIDYRDDADKRRRVAVEGGYTEARAALGKIRDRQATGKPVPRDVTVNYAEYAAEVLTKRHARGILGDEGLALYQQRLRDHIVPELGKMKLKAVTKHDVLTVVDKARAKGLSAWTIHSIIGVMSVVAKDATWDFELPNPVLDLKAEHRPKKTASATKMHVLSKADCSTLVTIGFLHGHERGVEGRSVGCLLALALGTGMRQSELLGLRWGDLTLKGDHPSVTACGQLRRGGKGWKAQLKMKDVGDTRTVEFGRDVAKLLLDWRMASPYSQDADYVFTNPETGACYQQAWARKVFVKARDAAKIQADLPEPDRCNFHDLRDTFASVLIAGGANIVEVQHALGHEKASTTLDMYAHLWGEQERRGKLRDILEAASA